MRRSPWLALPPGSPRVSPSSAGLVKPVSLATNDASLPLADTRQALLRAQTEGCYWIAPLRERVEALTEQVALLLFTAHARAEEAEGIVRAIDLARADQPWAPIDDLERLHEPGRVLELVQQLIADP